MLLLKNKELYFIAPAANGRQQAPERMIEEVGGFAGCISGPRSKGLSTKLDLESTPKQSMMDTTRGVSGRIRLLCVC